MIFNILTLNLNLSTQEIIKLKKIYNISFLKKKIIYKNLKLYGNFIFLKKIPQSIYFLHSKLIILLYIYNNTYLSPKKYKQIQIQKTFQQHTLYFIKQFK